MNKKKAKNKLVICKQLVTWMVSLMTCWKWFGSILKEAGVEAGKENREKIDAVIHKFIGEQSMYGRCSSDWRKARKEIEANDKMRREIIDQLKASA